MPAGDGGRAGRSAGNPPGAALQGPENRQGAGRGELMNWSSRQDGEKNESAGVLCMAKLV